MIDATIVSFRTASPKPNYRQYKGYILEMVERRIAKDQYTVTDIVIRITNSTKHRFSVTLQVGICLYLYIHSNNRANRMQDVLFKFTVDTDNQKVTDTLAYDASEWIGDMLDRGY